MKYNGPTPSIFEKFVNSPEYKFNSSLSKRSLPVSTQQSSPQANSLMSDPVARATAQGAQAGGASGALISGGVTSMLGPAGMSGGGPWAAAGGLILSQIEAAKAAKAREEQERVQNEKDRRNNMIGLYNNMAQTRFGV